ncbi:MAG: Fic family protein [Pseudoclavibacter sp.]
MPETRTASPTHPWIDFKFATAEVPASTWMQLGESYSKCQHMIGAPLQPGVATFLSSVYMRRGALASAQIEGNTLNEDEVKEIFVNNKSLPESQQYLEQEIENVLYVLESVRGEAASGANFRLTEGWLKAVHFELMQGLELPEHVVPGEYRDTSVGVGSYRGPNWGEVPELMESAISWINDILDDASKQERRDLQFAFTFYAAALAHLYVAWVHPFGDGNGRTARIVESAILANSGLVPWISTSLLSDYYNRTRTRYYEKLSAASTKGDVVGFIAYSALGLRDELRSQVEEVQRNQKRVAWINYVHERFQDEPQGDTAKRRRQVALDLPPDKAHTRMEIRRLNPLIAEMYAGSSDRLFRRDMTKLIELGLVAEPSKSRFVSRQDRMDAFTPSQENGADTVVLQRLKERRLRGPAATSNDE